MTWRPGDVSNGGAWAAMHSHFLYLVLFAGAVGAVLGAMLRSEPREAVRLGAWIAGALVGAALLIAWLMYFVSG